MKNHPLFANVLIPFFRFYCYSFPFYDDTDICAASRAQIIAIRAVLALRQRSFTIRTTSVKFPSVIAFTFFFGPVILSVSFTYIV